MTKINTYTTGHGNKREHYSGESIEFNVFPNSTALDNKRLAKVRRAWSIVNQVDAKIDLQGPCNKYFKTLPNHRNFHDYWRDDTIFINFSPSREAGFYGATHSNNKDVCVSAWCLDNHNHWMVAATIVHEVAHVAGAPGGLSHAAEKAVDMCGFKPQYDPGILGSLHNLGKYLEKLA